MIDSLIIFRAPNGSIHAWLVNSLSAFSPPEDFLDRFGKSVEEAVMRGMATELSTPQFDHLTLLVLAPASHVPNGSIRGFFQVERNDNDAEGESTNSHRIEYYLYMDKMSREDRYLEPINAEPDWLAAP